MATLNLTNLTTYKAYFADIADKHIGIDQFKWGDEKVLQNDNRSDLDPKVLWATPYEKATYSEGGDNIMKSKLARVSYLEPLDSELFASEDEQYVRCEALMEEIIARILRDKAGKLVGDEWVMLVANISTFTTSPVVMSLGSTKYIGCDLEMRFMDNTNLTFNATKWSDTL